MILLLNVHAAYEFGASSDNFERTLEQIQSTAVTQSRLEELVILQNN
jgi:hypothetical protein